MEDAAVKNREEVASAKASLEVDRHARLRAEKERAEVVNHLEDFENARNAAQAEANRNRVETEGLKRAAQSASNTLQQLLTSLPLHVEDALNGLVDIVGSESGLSGFRAQIRRERREQMYFDFDDVGGPRGRSGEGDPTAEALPAVPIDKIATHCTQALLTPLRRLITVRQHFQDAIAEAVKRREEQETVANNAMQALETRLAESAQNLAKLHAAQKVKETKEVAAAKEEARSRVEEMRIKLVVMEASGRDAAREAESEAERATKLEGRLKDTEGIVQGLRQQIENARRLQHDTERQLRETEAALREIQATLTERVSALERDVNKAQETNDGLKMDLNQSREEKSAIEAQLLEQADEYRDELSRQAEQNVKAITQKENNIFALKQELREANAATRNSELHCKDLEHQVHTSARELQMLSNSLRTSSLNGMGSVLGVDMPHESPVQQGVNSPVNTGQVQHLLQQQQHSQAQIQASAGQINQLQAQLSQVQAQAQQAALKLQQAQSNRHQLQMDAEQARAESEQARSERTQLQLQLQRMQQQQQQQQEQQKHLQQQLDETQRRMSPPLSTSTAASLPITGTSQRRARMHGGYHPAVVELDEIKQKLQDASQRSLSILLAVRETAAALSGAYNIEGTKLLNEGSNKAAFALSAAAEGLTRVGEGSEVASAAAAVSRAAGAAQVWEKREEAVSTSLNSTKKLTEDLGRLIEDVQELLHLAAHHIASAMAEVEGKIPDKGHHQRSTPSTPTIYMKAKSDSHIIAAPSPAPSWGSIVSPRNIIRPEGAPASFVTSINPVSMTNMLRCWQITGS